MSEPEEIWRKRNAHFVIEIKVGRTWVLLSDESYLTEAKARPNADLALLDRSVSGVRICEIRTTRVFLKCWERSSGPELRIPKQMRQAKGKAPCPRCQRSTSLMTDGVNDWTFCAKCNAALPVAS